MMGCGIIKKDFQEVKIVDQKEKTNSVNNGMAPLNQSLKKQKNVNWKLKPKNDIIKKNLTEAKTVDSKDEINSVAVVKRSIRI